MIKKACVSAASIVLALSSSATAQVRECALEGQTLLESPTSNTILCLDTARTKSGSDDQLVMYAFAQQGSSPIAYISASKPIGSFIQIDLFETPAVGDLYPRSAMVYVEWDDGYGSIGISSIFGVIGNEELLSEYSELVDTFIRRLPDQVGFLYS